MLFVRAVLVTGWGLDAMRGDCRVFGAALEHPGPSMDLEMPPGARARLACGLDGLVRAVQGVTNISCYR